MLANALNDLLLRFPNFRRGKKLRRRILADAIYDLLGTHGFIAETDRRGSEHYDEIFSRSMPEGGMTTGPETRAAEA